jgi:hypothetical protein
LSVIAKFAFGSCPALWRAWRGLYAGDFNGDGKADILWQNADGTPAVWLMNGTNLISGANVGLDPGSNWHVIPPHHDVLG